MVSNICNELQQMSPYETSCQPWIPFFPNSFVERKGKKASNISTPQWDLVSQYNLSPKKADNVNIWSI